MVVRCIANETRSVRDPTARERLNGLIKRDQPDYTLTIGGLYFVQALDFWKETLWFYLHTIEELDFPIPHPAEFFQIEDNSVPPNWCVTTFVDDGSIRVKRMTFCQWALDDSFYERLIDDDEEAIRIYKKHVAMSRGQNLAE